MEAHWNFTNRVTFLCLFVGMFVALLRHGHAKPEDPVKNVNLAPFWQWRSAYECLINVSNACSPEDVLTLAGVVDVNQTKVVDYCKKGCADRTLYILKCIGMVKRDFWFANRLTVGNLSYIINNGCAKNQSFSTVNITANAAIRTHGNLITPFASSLATVAILTFLIM